MAGRDLAVFTPDVVHLIWDRDRGRCAWCGRPVWGERGQDWHIHHREARGSGGGRTLAYLGEAANGVLAHASCHLGDIERDVNKARSRGFHVMRTGIRRPAEVPILHAVYGWCLLDSRGGTEPVDGPEK